MLTDAINGRIRYLRNLEAKLRIYTTRPRDHLSHKSNSVTFKKSAIIVN